MKVDLRHPIIRWLSGDVTVASGTSWLTFSDGKGTFLRLRRDDLLPDFTDWLSASMPSVANQTPFNSNCPGLELGWSGDILIARHAARQFRCEPEMLLDLNAWLSRDAARPPIHDAIERVRVVHEASGTFVELDHASGALRVAIPEQKRRLLAATLLAAVTDPAHMAPARRVVLTDGHDFIQLTSDGGAAIFAFRYYRDSADRKTFYLMRSSLVRIARNLMEVT